MGRFFNQYSILCQMNLVSKTRNVKYYNIDEEINPLRSENKYKRQRFLLTLFSLESESEIRKRRLLMEHLHLW